MLSIKKLIFFFLFFFSISNYATSNDKVAYADIDFILKNSNFGKLLLNELESISKKESEALKLNEKELLNRDNQIKSSKNIISEEEFKVKFKLLQNDIQKHNQNKKKVIENFNILKKKKLKVFFKEINPIIENYMSKNSIGILVDKKNIYIGRSNYDITSVIVDIINKK